jgi:hypothetical protein
MTKETPLDDAAEKRNLFYAHADGMFLALLSDCVNTLVPGARGRNVEFVAFLHKKKI